MLSAIWFRYPISFSAHNALIILNRIWGGALFSLVLMRVVVRACYFNRRIRYIILLCFFDYKPPLETDRLAPKLDALLQLDSFTVHKPLRWISPKRPSNLLQFVKESTDKLISVLRSLKRMGRMGAKEAQISPL